MQKSESIGQLAASLALAQAEILPASREAENPYFKSHYASIESVMGMCRAPLAQNGLAIIQTTEFVSEGETGRWCLRTTLAHKSGEWISALYPLSAGDGKAQSVGAAVTYARRYALMAMVGIVSAADDDDGNTISANPPPVPAAKPYTNSTPKTYSGNYGKAVLPLEPKR